MEKCILYVISVRTAPGLISRSPEQHRVTCENWLHIDYLLHRLYIYIYLLYRIKTIIRNLINFNKFEKNHLERTILEANWNQHISYELKFHKISYTLITFEAKNSPSQLYPPLNFRKRMQIGAVSIHLPFRRITIRQSPRWILIKCPPPLPDLIEKKRRKTFPFFSPPAKILTDGNWRERL